MQDKRVQGDVLAFYGGPDKCFRQIDGLGLSQQVAGYIAAEDIDDDVEIEIRAGTWAFEPCDVPTPKLVGSFRQQFGLFVDNVPVSSSALTNSTYDYWPVKL